MTYIGSEKLMYVGLEMLVKDLIQIDYENSITPDVLKNTRVFIPHKGFDNIYLLVIQIWKK